MRSLLKTAAETLDTTKATLYSLSTGGGLSGLYKQNVQNLVAQDPPNVNEKAAEELQGARKSKWRMEIMKDEAQKNQK